jgi:hypothetical protein
VKEKKSAVIVEISVCKLKDVLQLLLATTLVSLRDVHGGDRDFWDR